jgi:ABC-type bacteriocin/lantibiotic exporter with double-glycine peptidase domain
MKHYLSRLNRILPQLRWMAGYSHRYRWVVFWHILLGLLGTAMGLAASVVGKNIIDTVTGYQTGAVVTIALWYVSLQLIEILLSATTGYINERMHIKVSQQLRGEIFDSIIHARWQEISQYHSGDLLAAKELSLMYLTIFVLLYITGPGRYSIDGIFKRMYFASK